jgi:hypothetical protein
MVKDMVEYVDDIVAYDNQTHDERIRTRKCLSRGW